MWNGASLASFVVLGKKHLSVFKWKEYFKDYFNNFLYQLWTYFDIISVCFP